MEQRDERPEVEGAPEGRPGEESVAPADDLAGLSETELRAKLQEAREDVQRNWQHFLHSAADLENYKKQAARDRQDAVERTRRQMLTLVLSVVDNLERALAAVSGQPSADPAVIEGLRITHRQILGQLEVFGVRTIEAVGKAFDPRLHEAVGVVPPQEAGPGIGMVVGETLRGYLLNDEVLRPAKVIVVGEAAEEKAKR
ncbi:MAG TPA: nucleotide exchange factor GrpE [bacterium]|nr:nucleotide exchange factor GrpE [bacterium]